MEAGDPLEILRLLVGEVGRAGGGVVDLGQGGVLSLRLAVGVSDHRRRVAEKVLELRDCLAMALWVDEARQNRRIVGDTRRLAVLRLRISPPYKKVTTESVHRTIGSRENTGKPEKGK